MTKDHSAKSGRLIKIVKSKKFGLHSKCNYMHFYLLSDAVSSLAITFNISCVIPG